MSSETSTTADCDVCSICCRPVTTTAADAEVDNHDEGSDQSSTTTITMVTISERCNHKACQSCLEQWYDRSDHRKRTQRKQCLFCRIDLTTDELLKLYGSTLGDINAIPDIPESSPNLEVGTDGETASTENAIDEFTKHYIDTYTRQCKNCGWYVEKEDDTCDKMECLCGYRFCFQCGQEARGGGTSTSLPCNCSPIFHVFYDNARQRTTAFGSSSIVVSMLSAPATTDPASSASDTTTTPSVDSNNKTTNVKTKTVGQCVKARLLSDVPGAGAKRRRRAVELNYYRLEIQSNDDDHSHFPSVRYGSWLFDERGSKQGYARMKNQWNHLVNKGKTGTPENIRHRERQVYQNKTYCRDDVRAMSMRYLIPRLAYGAWLFEEGGYEKIRHNILYFWGRKRDCITGDEYLIRAKREDRRRRYEEYLNDGGNGDSVGDAQAVIKRHLNNWILIENPVVQCKMKNQLSSALSYGSGVEPIINIRKPKWNVV